MGEVCSMPVTNIEALEAAHARAVERHGPSHPIPLGIARALDRARPRHAVEAPWRQAARHLGELTGILAQVGRAYLDWLATGGQAGGGRGLLDARGPLLAHIGHRRDRGRQLDHPLRSAAA